ncbi:monosaccharide ABC transporter substrate-binding protein (CUT2 family) [Planomicrobium soli]|uniref:Monosaccharide ABC transporter substrate-binding protein (CUT2 family) n=1 Tax=Planomicrobium soli TaxID=1176648 RepID=A0A2P8GQW7_9BACL|nr:autoinducer 2 ABC transporter substrate-binding protein [Planomicrobium soli]PSL36360.1 monosaccharide ABC transporter substrate-binding protein (CUT2 family) [Planomicrobium soli]
MKALFSLFCTLFIVSACSLSSYDKESYEVIYSIDEVVAEEKDAQNLQQITIAIVPKVANIPYFNAVEEGALEAAKDLGVNLLYKGPAFADASQQISIIEELIEEEVDAIAVSANDPEQLAPVLLEAKENGINVITWDSDTVPEARDFFINMVDPETLGRHLMDTLAWNTDETGEFAVLTGALSAANLSEWLYWIKVHQQEYYPNMTLVEVSANDDDPQRAYASAKKLLKKYPDLKGIIGNSSVGPPAAAQAVKELGKEGEVAVVGLSSPNPMNEYLKDGSAQIITLWSPKKLGYLTVTLAHNSLKGKEPFDWQEISKVGKIRMIDNTVIMGDPMDFTKENVDQYDF